MAAGKNATKQVATDFEKIIHEARDRKKNEALAAKIFSRDRGSSTPLNGSLSSTGSLASRAGVKKQRGVASSKPRHSTGDINGEWVHDLHDSGDAKPGSLVSRITNPNLVPSANRPSQRAKQVAQALIRTELSQPASNPPPRATPPAGPKASVNQGLTIRGLAGPFVCLAQNFAPGTTAADIESALTPVCGIINRCRIIKTRPIVIAEVTFPNKEGADRAIEVFDGQTADGRVIKVYLKPGNQETPDSQLPDFQAPSGPRSMRNDVVIDGSMGFDDPMETDTPYSNGGGNGRRPPRGPAVESNSLYSDDVMRSNRRSRGFNRDGAY